MMVRCWKHSESLGETDASPAAAFPKFPPKAFWVGLSASVLLVVIALGLTGHLGLPSPPSQSPQAFRITAPDHAGLFINQSAVVDQQNNSVTLTVTSPANGTSTVLFDVEHGLICYKPVDLGSCLLQTMETSDYENVRSLIRETSQKGEFRLTGNETRRQTEFLGVQTASRADVSTLGEPLQALCRGRSVHWTRRAEGPGRQRLVYFCIDICFPSSICVSVCFYYLPE